MPPYNLCGGSSSKSSPLKAPRAPSGTYAAGIDFYQRNGAAIVDCAPLYRAPATNSGATLPFTLMWLPVRGAPPRVAGDLLRGCVEAILAQSYGLDPSSPIVRQVLGDLAC